MMVYTVRINNHVWKIRAGSPITAATRAINAEFQNHRNPFTAEARGKAIHLWIEDEKKATN